MGLGEISQKVVTYYKADVSDHKAKIRDLSGEQKKLAKQQLADLEAQNKRVDGHIGTVGKLATTFAAVGTAIAAVDFISNAFSSKLVKNMGQLRTEVQRLGGDGGPVSMMLNWEKAAENLNKRLGDTEAYMKRLKGIATSMLGEENAGIWKRDMEAFNKGQLQGLIPNLDRKLQEILDAGADGLSQEQIDSRNVKITALQGQREAASARLTEIIKDEADAQEKAARAAERAAKAAMAKAEADHKAFLTLQDSLFPLAEITSKLNEQLRVVETARALGTPGAEDVYRKLAGQIGARGGSGATINGIAIDPSFLKANAPLDFMSALGGPDSSLLPDLSNRNTERRKEGALGTKRTSMLESIFGSPDEMDIYRGAFASFSSTIQDSFDAWVDKSEGAGLSFKKLFREILGSSAKLMFGQAIVHGAMALGEWAWGRNVEAVKHGKAAAALGAGAVTVGAIARQLGAGGSAAAGTGGGSAAYGGDSAYGGRRGPDQGGPTNIYVGDDWARKSPREREEMADDIVTTANRRGGAVIVSRS
jgi:hypothetical protein